MRSMAFSRRFIVSDYYAFLNRKKKHDTRKWILRGRVNPKQSVLAELPEVPLIHMYTRQRKMNNW